MNTTTYQVYIIKSEQHGRFYVGMSADPDKRLHFHNLGLNTSTRNGAPWEQVWVSELSPRSYGMSLSIKWILQGADCSKWPVIGSTKTSCCTFAAGRKRYCRGAG